MLKATCLLRYLTAITSMEPITHFMTGACLARAGFNRKAAYATLAMTLAAEAPDLDTLWSAAGPVAAFQHHRGITHTLIGLPFDGLVVVGAVWLLHRWRARWESSVASHEAGSPVVNGLRAVRPLTAAPVRWGVLYGFVLIALLSHLLLDWTNNYGVRPFFPFDPHWYAGSIVFIFEPVLFVVLLLALVAPALFALIGGEVGARREVFRGRGWAIFALVAMVGLWGWREVEHEAAVRLASTASYGPVAASDEPVLPAQVLRVSASPYPGNPYRWHTVVETPEFYQMATVNSLRSTVVTDPEQDLFFKPPSTLATLVAKRSWLGKAYLDWSSWPVVADMGPTAAIGAPVGTADWIAVRFLDLRFLYATALLDGRKNPPLSGTVYVDADRRVAQMELGGRVQR